MDFNAFSVSHLIISYTIASDSLESVTPEKDIRIVSVMRSAMFKLDLCPLEQYKVFHWHGMETVSYPCGWPVMGYSHTPSCLARPFRSVQYPKSWCSFEPSVSFGDWRDCFTIALFLPDWVVPKDIVGER